MEVIDYRPGVAWLVDRIVELSDRYHASFAVDRTGPGGSFIDELLRRGVKVVDQDATSKARACADFYDRVVNKEVSVRRNADLDHAVSGAAKQPVGDQFVWGRKPSNVDISLLVAASIGVWCSMADHEGLVPFF